METIKNYIRLYPLRFVLTVSLIVLFVVGIGCYTAGRQSAERDANLSRVQTTERQLNDASKQLSEAARTNSTARNVAQRSEQLNESIKYSIDRGSESVENSKAANQRTATKIAEAQRIIADAKRTAIESERIARDSKSILEGARERTEKEASR